MSNAEQDPCFIPLPDSAMQVEMPAFFTNPFDYQPHALCLMAAEDLQNYLRQQHDWQHDFDGENGLGKMFGVLVVQNSDGKLGYLAAYSGKLADKNRHQRFVPPVFDILETGGFFKKEEAFISHINRQIELLEHDPHFLSLQQTLQATQRNRETAIQTLQHQLKSEKQWRDQQRQQLIAADISPQQRAAALEQLNQQSAHGYFLLKDEKRKWRKQLDLLQKQIHDFQQQIETLKNERKNKSARLQQRIFEQYTFLNSRGAVKSLAQIFEQTPPSGAGECAAPKLLQYAFLKKYRLLAMAEFWWGKSPAAEIRRHGNFYPACRSKCAPILAHMLDGIPMKRDRHAVNPAAHRSLDRVYEDEHLAVLHKPADFFSVPGKRVHDSVLARVRHMYPHADGPLLVHRLDVATSGLLLVAQSKWVHQQLQSQFAKRKVRKRYVALLDGILDPQHDAGEIHLPLRVDLDDRPRQLVCFQYGKPAHTQWQVVERHAHTTRVHFFPITGRTHQLRVHAAHHLGLNTPILGDELYGTRAERLFLHAERLEFEHPVSREWLTLEVPADF